MRLSGFKMMRITVVDSSNSVVRLRVEGRLTGRSAEELRQACDLHALGEGMRLILDLADLSFADAHGIEILKNLKRHNVSLLNLVPYLALQLRDPQTGKPPARNKGDAAEGNS
jgi:anti-anti-sigma factor